MTQTLYNLQTMEEYMQCNTCKCDLFIYWQTFKDGTRHIRGECPVCKKMKGYLPKTVQNIELANGKTSMVEDLKYEALYGAISDSIILLTSGIDLDESPEAIKGVAALLIHASKKVGKKPPSWYRSEYEKECWTKSGTTI